MEEYVNIGKIDKEKLGHFGYQIKSESVILTNERIKHIKNRHQGNYEEFINDIPDVLYNPDFIVQDDKNVDTILILKKIKRNNKNLQIVVKLMTSLNKNKFNSIITFWEIRESNYKKIIKNKKIIYKKLDKFE